MDAGERSLRLSRYERLLYSELQNIDQLRQVFLSNLSFFLCAIIIVLLNNVSFHQLKYIHRLCRSK